MMNSMTSSSPLPNIKLVWHLIKSKNRSFIHNYGPHCNNKQVEKHTIFKTIKLPQLQFGQSNEYILKLEKSFSAPARVFLKYHHHAMGFEHLHTNKKSSPSI